MKIKGRFVIIGIFTGFLVTTTSFTTSSLVSAFTSLTPTVTVAQIQGNTRSNERQQITSAILQNNQPISTDAPVQVKRIAIVNGYAIAIVVIGENGGGMSALKKTQSGWQVIGGGGGAFDYQYLVEKGVPTETAKQLMQRIESN